MPSHRELLQFAEAAQVPVLTTLKGKGTFPEIIRSPWVCAFTGEHFLRKCDLLFSIGSSLFPNRFSHAVPIGEEGDRAVHGGHARHQPQLRNEHCCDRRCALTLQALSDELAKQGGSMRKNAELVEEIRAGKQEFLAKFRP